MKAVDQHILWGACYTVRVDHLSTNIIFPYLYKKMQQWNGTFHRALIFTKRMSVCVGRPSEKGTNMAGHACRVITPIEKQEETPALAFAESKMEIRGSIVAGLIYSSDLLVFLSKKAVQVKRFLLSSAGDWTSLLIDLQPTTGWLKLGLVKWDIISRVGCLLSKGVTGAKETYLITYNV